MHPNWKSCDVNYWKQLFCECDTNRRKGWRSFHRLGNVHFRLLRTVARLNGIDDGFIPSDIKEEFDNHITTFNNDERNHCTICTEKCTVDNCALNRCGHFYHQSCLPTDICLACNRRMVLI